MVARAEAKYIKISPQKARLVIAVVRGKRVVTAFDVLESLTQKGAYHLKGVLKSAVANAKNKGYEDDKLFISKIVANSGPMLKRWRSASFGRATMIKRRTSHIVIELDSPEKLVSTLK